METLVGVVIVAVLIVANGVFVATEFAYIRARRSRLEARAAAGSAGARTVLRARTNLDRYIAASQLGITMASLALGFVGEPLLAGAIEPPIEALVGGIAPVFAHAIAIGTAFALITALHIVFGELIPKTVALTRPESTAIAVSGPVALFVTIFRPLVALLNGTGNLILRAAGIPTTPIEEEPRLTGRDLVYVLESSASVGAISRREQRLAERAIELGELNVRDLMQPRDRVAAVEITDDREALLEQVARHVHSRYPVVRGSLDAAEGFIDVRDIVLADPGEDWRSRIRAIPTLPDSMALGPALDELTASRTGIALVSDEYGNIDGIIALGDIVEFLAGPLPDEHHRGSAGVWAQPDGSLVVSGLFRLDQARKPPLRLDVGVTESQTVGGLVAERLQRLPRVGDGVVIGDRRVRVLAISGRRVERVRVEPAPAPRATP
jgi:putative hemolysin